MKPPSRSGRARVRTLVWWRQSWCHPAARYCRVSAANRPAATRLMRAAAGGSRSAIPRWCSDRWRYCCCAAPVRATAISAHAPIPGCPGLIHACIMMRSRCAGIASRTGLIHARIMMRSRCAGVTGRAGLIHACIRMHSRCAGVAGRTRLIETRVGVHATGIARRARLIEATVAGLSRHAQAHGHYGQGSHEDQRPAPARYCAARIHDAILVKTEGVHGPAAQPNAPDRTRRSLRERLVDRQSHRQVPPASIFRQLRLRSSRTERPPPQAAPTPRSRSARHRFEGHGVRARRRDNRSVFANVFSSAAPRRRRNARLTGNEIRTA